MALTKTHNRMISGSVLNVRDFGAVPTEEVSGFDSTAAFQAAFSALTGTGGCLHIPVGTFSVSSNLDWPSKTTISGDGFNSLIELNGAELVLDEGFYWTGLNFSVKRVGAAGYAMRMEGISQGSRRINFENVRIDGSTGGGVIMKGGWLMTWVNPYIERCAGIGMLIEEGGFVTGWNSLDLIGGHFEGNDIGIVIDRAKQVSIQGTAIEGQTTAGIGIGNSVESLSILGYFEANASGHIVPYNNSGGTIGQVSSMVVKGGSYFLKGTAGSNNAISIPAVRQLIIEDGVAIRGYAANTNPIVTVADVGDSERGRGYLGQIRTDAPADKTLSNGCWYFGRDRLLSYSNETTMAGASDTTVNFPVNPSGYVLNSAKRALVTATVNLTGSAGDGVFIIRGRNSAGTVVSAMSVSTVALTSGINSFTIFSGSDWSDDVAYIDFARSGTSVQDTAGDVELVGVQITSYVNPTVNV